MTVGPCDSGTAGAIVELSLFLEGPDHGQPHLQELRPQRRCRRLLQLVRRGDHGQCPQPSLPRPMEETSIRRATDTSTVAKTHGRRTHPVNSACSIRVAPALALQSVTIMRKIAACWTCGRTFWVWRLRERNFCSGKCRVRHHRSAFRKPSPSTSGRTPAGTG